MDADCRTETLTALGGELLSASKLTSCPAVSEATSYASTAAAAKSKRPPSSDRIAPDNPLPLNDVIVPCIVFFPIIRALLAKEWVQMT